MRDNKFITSLVIVAVVVMAFGLYASERYMRDNANVPAAAKTNVIHYLPVTSAEVLSSVTETGECFASSIAAPYRPDAWRCTVGNAISDPCFQIPDTPNLFCDIDPSNIVSSSAFILKLDKPLPKPDISTSMPHSDNWGWFVELSDGTVCTPFTGTLPFSIEGDVANYACRSTTPTENMIFNGLDSSTTPWTAEVGTLSTSTGTFPPQLVSSSTITIKNVWQ